MSDPHRMRIEATTADAIANLPRLVDRFPTVAAIDALGDVELMQLATELRLGVVAVTRMHTVALDALRRRGIRQANEKLTVRPV